MAKLTEILSLEKIRQAYERQDLIPINNSTAHYEGDKPCACPAYAIVVDTSDRSGLPEGTRATEYHSSLV